MVDSNTSSLGLRRTVAPPDGGGGGTVPAAPDAGAPAEAAAPPKLRVLDLKLTNLSGQPSKHHDVDTDAGGETQFAPAEVVKFTPETEATISYTIENPSGAPLKGTIEVLAAAGTTALATIDMSQLQLATGPNSWKWKGDLTVKTTTTPPPASGATASLVARKDSPYRLRVTVKDGTGEGKAWTFFAADRTIDEKVKLLFMQWGGASPWAGAMLVTTTQLAASLDVPAASKKYRDAHGIDLWVACDQEGGDVDRLKSSPKLASDPKFKLTGTTFPKAAELAAMDPQVIEAEGKRTGDALTFLGINMILAPDLDAATTGLMKGSRSFGDTPDKVIAAASSWVRGLRSANAKLLIVGKHYPGYNVPGNTDKDSDKTGPKSVWDYSSKADVLARARPFREVGVSAIMISSIRFSAYGSLPAGFDKSLIDELRAKQPDVLVMSDDLVPALKDTDPEKPEVRPLRALRAGCDVLIMLDGKVDARDGLITHLKTADGAADLPRLDDAVDRVLRKRA